MDALQVVSQPHRREILRLVWNAELSAGQIAECFDVTFGAISQHLRVLESAGLARHTKAGTRRLYELDAGGVEVLRAWVDGFWTEALSRFKAVAEAAPREGGTR